MQLHPENFRYRPCLSKMSLCVDGCKHIWAIEDTELNVLQTTIAENCQNSFLSSKKFYTFDSMYAIIMGQALY